MIAAIRGAIAKSWFYNGTNQIARGAYLLARA
jgi:hypothetical protein